MSMIVPFCRFGESADEVLVTTIVHSSAAPTLIGSGVQLFVTANRRLEQVGAVTRRRGGRRGAARVGGGHRVHQRVRIAGQRPCETPWPNRRRPRRQRGTNEALMSPSSESMTDLLVTVTRPVLHTSMV